MSTKAGSVLLALIGGGVWLADQPPPVVHVNENNALLSEWPSESALGGNVGPECAFWNMSVVYESSLCSHFAIGRSASTPARANQRALACAAAFGVECVLSPEIGLALPAAFLYSHDRAAMTMVLAPKLVPHDSEQVHVRVAPPGGDGLTDTKTLHFNRTVKVEYLEGATRQLRSETLSDDAAFCVQLLRLSFEPQCWEKLD
jgi:hypothetical protein